MGIIIWIIFGGLVGWIASFIVGNERDQGVIFDIVVGIIGSIVGGFVMTFFGENGVTGFNLYSFIISILGAITLIIVIRSLRSIP